MSVTEGLIGLDDRLDIVSELNAGGGVFSDGIESDRVDVRWGVQATVRVARE